MATDDEVLSLLREIRDLQQQHLEAYRAQSQRAISMSAAIVKRQRIGMVLVIVGGCLLAWYAGSRSDVSEWKAIQDRAQQQLDQSDKQWRQQMDATRRGDPIDDAK